MGLSASILELKKKINVAFTPRTPIENQQFFSGRIKQLKKIQDSFLERGCQIIIYGDRGVGKTSLANITKKLYENVDKRVICTKVSCDPTETFSNLWIKTFTQVNISYETTNKIMGFDLDNESRKNESKILPANLIIKKDKILKSNDILNILKKHHNNTNFLFIFDEFDRIDEIKIKEQFTYLMKHISDSNINITVMLVGIAENIEELIESHESIERCLKQIYLPRMENNEIEEIINNGLKYIKIKMEDKLKKRIVELSEGLPQYTHLFCRHSINHYLEKADITSDISLSDFKGSINTICEEMDESIKRKYQKAIIDDKSNIYEELLIACASAPIDEYNSFTQKDVRNILKDITTRRLKKSYVDQLKQLCDEKRGSILKLRGNKRLYRFEFRNPLIKMFINLKKEEKDKK